jgi:hypothetical protein
MRSGTGPGWPVATPRVRAARDDPVNSNPVQTAQEGFPTWKSNVFHPQDLNG